MIKQIVSALSKFWKRFQQRPQEVPMVKPVPQKPAPIKGQQVFDNYLVVEYKGQKVSLHKNQIPIWNDMSRKDKRIMAEKFKKQIALGNIRFELINNKWICLKNKNYGVEKDNK